MSRFLFIIFVVIFYASILGGSFLFWQDKFQVPYNNKLYTGQASLVPPKLSLGETKLSLGNKDTLVLLFAGDIMLDRGVEWYAKQHQDWNWPFLRIADFLQEADLVFGNLESVISNKGENQGSIYSFRAEPETLKALVFAGFDILSVANNHSLDYGSEALVDSIQRLKDSDILPVGGGQNRSEAHAPVFKTIRDTTIAFLAFSAVGSPLWQAGEQSPGIAWMDSSKLSQLKQDIEAAQKLSDIVVVSFHFGEEYQTEPNDTQKLISKAAIDAGADVVVGHHPHVVQPLEQYKNGWIAYSLGNFVFDQGFSKETMEGIMLKVLIKEKSITQVTPLKIQLSSSFQPAISIESI